MDERARIKALLRNPEWRLNNLYKIRNAQGELVQFKPNWAQKDFYNNLHYFNVILKARQLGFSTFTAIYMLDAAMFNSNHRCGIIDAAIDDAKKKLKMIKLAYRYMPEWLQELNPMTVNAAEAIEFESGSGVAVGTSLRGDTLQKLHVSEYGKISARNPEKAREIKTGALNTVHAGQQIFVESTAEGQQGEFYELVQLARHLKQEGRQLSPLDPAFHFYGWNEHPDYSLNEDEVSRTLITRELQEYFDGYDPKLLPGQKAWYVKKKAVMGDDMKREFPATADEAFEQSMKGAYFTDEMRLVRERKQITIVPHEPSKKVFTFWDIGLNDDMCIWFFQHIGNEYRFIDYHESNGQGWNYYAQLLQSKGYVYEEHVWPHDGNKRIQGKEVQTSKQMAMELGIRPIRVVGRTSNVGGDIKNFCKPVLPRCWFDAAKCADGIKHLDNYRKEWDDKLGAWKDSPLHDGASHCADAFRTFAVGYQGRSQELVDYQSRPVQADMDYDLYAL